MLKRFSKFYRPYLLTFLFDMFCVLMCTIIGMVYPIITRKMLNVFIPNRQYKLIIVCGIGLFLAYLLKMLMNYFMNYYGHIVGVNMQADMRREMFAKIEKLPFSYFDEHETGKIMTRITSDVQEISELAHHGPEMILMSIVSIIFSITYLSSINLNLALIIFSCVPILFAIVIVTRKYHITNSRKARTSLSIISANINSSISGIRVTKAFNNIEKEKEKFEEGNKLFIEARKGQYKSMSIQHSSANFVTDVFNVICLISGGIFLYQNKISFGDYSTFIVSVNLFTSPILKLIQFMETFEEGVTGFERYCEIMDEPIEEDKPGAKDYVNLQGNIEFKKVNFVYSQNIDERQVLNDVSFKVEKGKTIALVGPSGGGKTTICHLIPRFYHVKSGHILIDDVDIEDITMRSLRENIGIVQQDVFLFSGSFYDNIAYGKLDASEDEIILAAKKANIYDYIMSLPNGFNTQIGERGVKLSGGQKQRLSIARAFLKNPPILILDEATSALDNTTEILIQKSLNSLKKGRTTIVVAHRLSTIKNADEILVVSNGKIKEKGNHETLLKKKNGIYGKLYQAQFKDDYNISLEM